jgi:hypothetical protein
MHINTYINRNIISGNTEIDVLRIIGDRITARNRNKIKN